MAKLSWNQEELKNRNRSTSGANVGIDSGSGISQGYHHGSLKNGLVAYYPFDGDVKDKTPLNNHGTDNTSAGYVTGKVGTDAKEFDGSDDYVSLPKIPSLGEKEFTVSLWVNGDDFSDGTYQTIFNVQASSPTNPLVIGSTSSDTLRFFLNDGSSNTTVTTSSVSNNQWYHLVAIRRSGEQVIFLNGTKEDTASPPGQIPVKDLAAGARADQSSHSDVSVDDLRIYDRALSLPEIKALYNLTKTSTVTEKDTLT